MKKVIIAGSRKFNDFEYMQKELDKILVEPVVILSGCAKGADALGEKYAAVKGYPIEKHPAKWSNLEVENCVVKYNSYGPYNALAGYNRNDEMLNSILENDDKGFVVVFWDGKSYGTKHMKEISEKNGIEVKVVMI